MLRNRKYFIVIIAVALFLKLLLFVYASVYDPRIRFDNDSADYLNTGMMLVTHGVFAQEENQVLKYELNRTPGYPLFLGILHGILKIPLGGVIFVQVVLTLLAAWITYKAALEINPRTAMLAAIIVLYSQPIAIYSLMIMTEALYLLLISLFMLVFIRYLKKKESRLLLVSAILLALATYVRPVSYYLCAAIPLFIIYANIRDQFKKAILHAAVFLLIACGLLGVWQLRNYLVLHQNIFSSIIQGNQKKFGIFHSYAANSDPFTQGMPPLQYYLNVTWRCFLSLMTRPVSYKYFHSYPLTVAGKIIGYPFVVFWFTGFLIGLSKVMRNKHYQFLACVILYFICVTIGSDMWFSGERFRVPMIPFIAIISAAGWIALKDVLCKNEKKTILGAR